MKWILKYYIKSKYLGYSKVYYKEFEFLNELKSYTTLNKIKIMKFTKGFINYEIIFSII